MSEKTLNAFIAIFFLSLALGVSAYFLWPEEKSVEPEMATVEDVIEITKPPVQKKQDVREVKVKPLEVIKKKNLKAPMKVKPIPPPPKVDVTGRRYPPGLKKNQVFFKVIKGGYAISFGDVIMGKLPPGQEKLKEGAFEPKKPQLWPSNVIPYQITEGMDVDKIQDAIAYFERETPIKFVPLTQEDKNGIVFAPTEENCASLLGMVAGIQPILLSPECGKGEILHEIMHALGFVHEHSREERDQFINIQWDNIKEEFLSQFNIVPDSLIHNYSGSVFSFDYESIMLYPELAFSKDGKKKTLVSNTNQGVRPSKDKLSRIDKERVYYLYSY